MSECLSVGVLGCGGIAECIFEECRDLSLIRRVGAFDVDPERRRTFCDRFGFKETASVEDLLDDRDVEAVFLTAPAFVREDQIEAVAAAGKAVFTEKPLALSVEKAKRVVEVCRESKVPLMVGQVLRYIGGYPRMIEIVRGGDLGSALGLEIHRYGGPFGDPYRNPWRLKKSTSGGLLFEVHVHEFDLARRLCGNPKTVTARTRRMGMDPETDYEDVILGIIEFENGLLGETHFSQIAAHGETRTVIFCEKGTVWGNFAELFIRKWGGEPERIPLGKQEPPFRKEVRLFAEAVLEDRPVPIPGEEGLWAVAMAEAYEESARSGSPVSIQEIGGFQRP